MGRNRLFFWGVVLAVLAVPTQALAGTYQFTDQPITFKHDGIHRTFLGYEFLTTPQPALSLQDDDESARFLIVHMKESVSKEFSEAEEERGYKYTVLSGPNVITPYSGKIPKSLTAKYTILGEDRNIKIKPGHTKNFDIIYSVFPDNDLRFSLEIDYKKNELIKLIQIQSKNGITPDANQEVKDANLNSN